MSATIDRRRKPISHGTPSGYKRCDCAPCKAGHARRRAEYRARTAGQEPLGPRAQVGAVRCACGQVCANRTALGKHTWARHDRPPTDAERVILTEQAVA